MDKTQVAEEARAFFEAADVDKNGSIDFGEWSAATINKRTLLNEHNLKATFDLFDKDGGGSISAEEIAQILGHNMSKDQSVWKEIIKEVDLNGDGQIDYLEFKTMMKHFIDDKKERN
jgi:calcium-dependent protein kinase